MEKSLSYYLTSTYTLKIGRIIDNFNVIPFPSRPNHLHIFLNEIAIMLIVVKSRHYILLTIMRKIL